MAFIVIVVVVIAIIVIDRDGSTEKSLEDDVTPWKETQVVWLLPVLCLGFFSAQSV